MTQAHTQARVERKHTQAHYAEKYFQMKSLMKSYRTKNGWPMILVSDVIIMRSKFHIFMNKQSELILVKGWDGEVYGTITLGHAKRLIKNDK